MNPTSEVIFFKVKERKSVFCVFVAEKKKKKNPGFVNIASGFGQKKEEVRKAKMMM